jgi:hypothetical protein
MQPLMFCSFLNLLHMFASQEALPKHDTTILSNLDRQEGSVPLPLLASLNFIVCATRKGTCCCCGLLLLVACFLRYDVAGRINPGESIRANQSGRINPGESIRANQSGRIDPSE